MILLRFESRRDTLVFFLDLNTIELIWFPLELELNCNRLVLLRIKLPCNSLVLLKFKVREVPGIPVGLSSTGPTYVQIPPI